MYCCYYSFRFEHVVLETALNVISNNLFMQVRRLSPSVGIDNTLWMYVFGSRFVRSTCLPISSTYLLCVYECMYVFL